MGLRAGEVVKLKLSDLEAEKGDGKRRLRLRTRKGAQVDTDLFLEGKVLVALEDWLKGADARIELSPESPLFLGFAHDASSRTLGLRREQRPLTVRQVENVISSYVKRGPVDPAG